MTKMQLRILAIALSALCLIAVSMFAPWPLVRYWATLALGCMFLWCYQQLNTLLPRGGAFSSFSHIRGHVYRFFQSGVQFGRVTFGVVASFAWRQITWCAQNIVAKTAASFSPLEVMWSLWLRAMRSVAYGRALGLSVSALIAYWIASLPQSGSLS